MGKSNGKRKKKRTKFDGTPVMVLDPIKVVKDLRGDPSLKKSDLSNLQVRPATPCGPKLRGHVNLASWEIVGGDKGFVSVGNEKRLFHGTPECNLASIVKKGLATGSKTCMFGPGIYFGEIPKAMAYTGWALDRSKFVFECLVSLGTCKVELAPTKWGFLSLSNAGYHSVHGAAGRTSSYGGTLRNNEWVVYNPSQVKMLYIHEYKVNLIEQTPSKGLCHVAKRNTVAKATGRGHEKKMRTFSDVEVEQACGKATIQRLNVTKGNGTVNIWVCPECIQENRYKSGSRIRWMYPQSYFGTRPVVDARVIEQLPLHYGH